MISLSGIGSGLDIQTIVKQLVAAEGQAKTRSLDTREGSYNSQLSALGRFKSALSGLQTAAASVADSSELLKLSTNLSDIDYFTATANSSSDTGRYSVEVVSLAASHKISTLGYPDVNTEVGSGIINISSGANSFSVSIPSPAEDPTKQSLNSIKDAINAEVANESVIASVVTVDDGIGGTEARLILTARDTGVSNAISVSVLDNDGDSSDGIGLSALTYDASAGSGNMTALVTAKDAIVKIDTLTVTNESNSISNVIPGVTLELKKAEIGKLVKLEIGIDSLATKDSINNLVQAYNSLVDTYNSVAGYNADTETGGVLLGDYLSRQTMTDVRNLFRAQTGSVKFPTLFSAGIEIDSKGKMQINSARLETLLASSPDELGKIVSGNDGIAGKIEARLNEVLGVGGSFDKRTTSLNSSLDKVNTEREALTLRLDALEGSLLKQFIVMDSLVAQYGATGSYLSNQLAALPGFSTIKSR